MAADGDGLDLRGLQALPERIRQARDACQRYGGDEKRWK